MNGGRAVLADLARAGRPGRTLAVGMTAAVLAVKAGNTAVTVVALVVAVVAGQLLAAWAQQRLGAGNTPPAARASTAVAGSGAVGAIEIAIFVAFVVTVFASVLLGWRGGVAQLAVVAGTFLGTLPGAPQPADPNRRRPPIAPAAIVLWVAAAALLPAVATLALPTPTWPAWWAVASGAAFGAAVACTDSIGTAAARTPLSADPGGRPRATPLTRVPWPHGILVPTAALLLVGVTALLALAPHEAPDPITVIGAIAAVVLIAAGARELWHEPDRRATLFTVAVLGPIFLAMVISAGGTLR